tara:strand:+ start:1874 stop:2197 length:324 start_codon:yes stop_codon:yes gene_type:complete
MPTKTHLQEYKDLVEKCIDTLDYIKQTYHYDRKTIHLAKCKIRSGMSLLNHKTTEKDKQLSQKALYKLMDAVQDLISGKVTRLYLERSEDDTGIYDIINGRDYPFDE